MIKFLLKFGIFAILAISVYYGLTVDLSKSRRTGTTISNTQEITTDQTRGFSEPAIPQALPQGLPQGVQVIHSLLGLEVKFYKGQVNYPAPLLINDPRYQALTNSQKLVDSIKFQPGNGPLFLILIAIGKGPTGAPLVVPGKFDIVYKTPLEGFVVRDTHGRAFYYSGYTMKTSAWQTLQPGQILQDGFCKDGSPLELCAANRRVNILLKKSVDPSKDVPLLSLLR